MRSGILTCSALAASMACQQPAPSLSSAERAAVADTATRLTDSLFLAAEKADFDAWSQYLHNTADFRWAYQARTWHSRAATDVEYRPTFERLRSQAITVSRSSTTVMAPDLAYVLREGSYTQTDTAGKTSKPIRFAIGTTWARRNGEWKVLTGFQSDQSPDSAAISSMKHDLHALILAQEAYYHGTYAQSVEELGTLYTASSGVKVILSGVTKTIWSATATHPSTTASCIMTFPSGTLACK